MNLNDHRLIQFFCKPF